MGKTSKRKAKRRRYKLGDVVDVTTPRGPGKFKVVRADDGAGIILNLLGCGLVGLRRLTPEARNG